MKLEFYSASFGVTRKLRTFVKATEEKLSKGISVAEKDIADFKLMSEGTKFSKNPVKNLYYFCKNYREVFGELNRIF